MTKAHSLFPRSAARSRRSWLAGASLIASASVLAMAPLSPARAEAPGAVGMGGAAGPAVRNGPIGRNGLPRVRIAEWRERAEPRNLPLPLGVPQNPRQPVTITPVNTVINPGNTAPISTSTPLTGQASVTSTAQAATGPARATVGPVNGISVLASATFDDTQVAFSPNASGDNVFILGPSAIIDWTTFTAGASGTEVTFLPTGNNLNFLPNGGGAANGFTVLNRVMTPGFDSAIRIDGNVSTGGTPGNIWFYSPGGIVIGGTASFNVGSLLLSTSTIDPASLGSASISLTGVTDSASAIRIEPGATITTPLQGSYVAMVAPRIEQGGTVDVNGSAAYVGAEQATLTISNGLFDIAVQVGTDDPNGVVHTGTTTGDASIPGVDAFGNIINPDGHGIYMVAVPKNTAISMLVGGTIGYRPATAAALAPNGSIILSAGADVSTGGSLIPASFTFTHDPSSNPPGASVDVGTANFTSSVFGFASDVFEMMPSAGETVTIGGDPRDNYELRVEGASSIRFGAGVDGVLNIAGNVSLRGGLDETSGGNINLIAAGGGAAGAPGQVTIGGNLVADSHAFGAQGDSSDPVNGNGGVGGDANGGDIAFDIGQDATLAIGGGLLVISSAQGGFGDVQTGTARAGNVTINLDGGAQGSLSVAGQTLIDTSASAQLSGQGNQIAANGADVFAGDVTFNLLSGNANFGPLTILARADGATATDNSVVQNLGAFAGDVLFNVQGAALAISDLSINAEALSGQVDDPNGEAIRGIAGRGTARLLVGSGGTLSVTNNTFINLQTTGEASGASTDVVVLEAVGSDAQLRLGNVFIDAHAEFGAPGVTTQAGSMRITADGGSISFGGLFHDAFALADFIAQTSPNSGDNFAGGDLDIVASNNGSIIGNNLFANISGTGSDRGGNGTGGNATIDATGGSIDITGSIGISANGEGGVGTGANGANLLGRGQGGQILVNIGVGGLLSVGDLSLINEGRIFFDVESGSGTFFGDGGAGDGGDLTINLDGGTLTANSIFISSAGYGGIGGLTDTSVPAETLKQPRFVSPGTVAGTQGGIGQGGNVVFNLNSGSATVGDLTVSADGFGGDGGDGDFAAGVSGGNGGDGIGGSATFNALGGTLDVTGTLRVTADADGGSGGFGPGVGGGDGGNAFGGSALFNLNGSATINANLVSVTALARGGRGGNSSFTFDAQQNQIDDAGAGRGGDAIGGTAQFIDDAGALSFSRMTLDASGTGGRGGSSSGITVGDAVGAGGDGGDGTGGDALVSLNQDNPAARSFTVASRGTGGLGGSGAGAGNGGAGAGGNARLDVNDVQVGFATLIIDAGALGGNGGLEDGRVPSAGASGGDASGGVATLSFDGPNAAYFQQGTAQISANAAGGIGAAGGAAFAAGLTPGIGGAGGSASGGTAQFIASNQAVVMIDASSMTLGASAAGGAGGDGGAETTGGTAGNGGNGGDGTGGIVRLASFSGADLSFNSASIAFALDSSGTGGTGGFGGDANSLSGGTAGNGGNGGAGIGGSPTLSSAGGTISGADIDLLALGTGGNGGGAGDGGGGLDGRGGTGIGGTPLIELITGGAGGISLGALFIDASGIGGTGSITGITTGGSITITDNAGDPTALLSVDSLDATAQGDFAPTQAGFTLNASSGPVDVIGSARVDTVGDIQFNFDGDGQLTAGGSTILFSSGDILVFHTNNGANTLSIDSVDDIFVRAGGNFLSAAGSIINGQLDVDLRAEALVDIADIRAVRNLLLQSGGSMHIDNASAIGGSTTGSGSIVIAVGVDPNFQQFDPAQDLDVTGVVSAASTISIQVGGTARFRGGSHVLADQDLGLVTGDDIIVESGAILEAGVSPISGGGLLQLDAGGLRNSLTGPLLTPISSIVIDGLVDANDGQLTMIADAIDGLDGSVAGGSISADIFVVPPPSPQRTGKGGPAAPAPSDDAGLLSPECVEGNVCLGSIAAANLVAIGQMNPGSVIAFTGGQGGISGDILRITTQQGITVGAGGSIANVDAPSLVSLTSLNGDITVTDASITSDQILLDAAGSLLGNGNFTSTNDIGITVSGDLIAGSIDTGGQLTQVADVGGAPESSYDAPGNFLVNAISIGVGDLVINAAGNITIGAASVPDTNITLSTSGNVSLANATTAGDIDITANAAMLAGLQADNISVGADGDVVVGGDVIATQQLLIDALGMLDLQSGLASGAVVDLTVADINIGTSAALGDAAQTNSIAFNIDGDATIGGAGAGAAPFELDNGEFSRVHSGGDITFNVFAASPGSNPVLTIDTLDILAGTGSSPSDGNIGQDDGTLLFSSEGGVDVVGNATLTNAGSTTRMEIAAINSVFIDLANGGLFMLDANNGLAGTIDISATDLLALTSAAMADIQGMSLDQIDQRLAQNDGVDRPDGVIRADTLNIDTTASRIFIQNTGTGTAFDDRRGFTVNALNISDSGGTVQPIVINGIVNGQKGAAAIAATNITSSFDPLSTINGCLIVDPASCSGTTTPSDPDVTNDDPIRDQIDDELDPTKDQGDGDGTSGMMIIMRPLTEYEEDPLIDEPVTGAGNEDLWVDPDDCSETGDGEQCEGQSAE